LGNGREDGRLAVICGTRTIGCGTKTIVCGTKTVSCGTKTLVARPSRGGLRFVAAYHDGIGFRASTYGLRARGYRRSHTEHSGSIERGFDCRRG
jgi:hypothetical protein